MSWLRRWWLRVMAVFLRPSREFLALETARKRLVLERELAEPSRRQLLGGGVAVVGLAVLSPGTAGAAGPAPLPVLPPSRHRWGMAIDLDRCTACGSCTVACREENNVPVIGPGDGVDGSRPEWMSLLWRETGGASSLPEALPFPCMQCEDAPCVKACPVGATFMDNEGIVAQIYDRCIGCRYCMVACPYTRRSFNWEEPKWDGTLVQLLNPDVATRPKGVVEKCTFCHHRVQRVKEEAALAERAPTDGELQRLPACAAACPSHAITFGDKNDPSSAVSRLSESPRAFRLLEHLGTKPAVVYLKRDRKL